MSKPTAKHQQIVVNDQQSPVDAYVYDCGLAIYARPNGRNGKAWMIQHLASRLYVIANLRKLQAARIAVEELIPLVDWTKELSPETISEITPAVAKIAGKCRGI